MRRTFEASPLLTKHLSNHRTNTQHEESGYNPKYLSLQRLQQLSLVFCARMQLTIALSSSLD